ncbi:hypothetical protein COCMIDRAFT_86698 [Bipolaris oryzae ATCC 44560]|uniref:C2H2-type domain-containing protein n=1 Tax=Bipolaris oryzae ATCC 44560 TaxID=930090 RepID=W6ZF30_COCMI|nr:uncharacterized protein COCMIDRAFT_86698 [Bipolaris oryzae ATCC 44560]EUC48615.1 hypothetical protein COCMIDRAFT_86698 [Bipolaris oryzae ATCC 44560]
MDDNVEIPEESMRHIEALLARHPPHLIQRMFSQALDSLPAAMSSDTDSPLDLKIEPSSTPTDNLSVASPVLFADDDKSQSQTGESYMFCTYCAEQKNQKTFKAKSDWKKHEMRMHETGEDWPCIVNGCNRIFDRQKDFIKHHQRYHTGRPLPSLTDIGITLLPRRVFGCGFDKCKEVSIGWDERCDHVAKHMKNGATIDQWKYSNVIRNLIRQEALYDTWKELISCLDERLRESRSQISWCPDNTRILRQKLQCCDLRPSREEVLITALSLRSDMQLDPVDQQLPPGFVTPSRDSVPNVEKLSREQRMHVLIGNSDPHVARARLATVNAALVRAVNSLSHLPNYDCASSPFMEPQSPARDTTNHRISYMDVDPGDYLDVAQPAIPDLPPVMTTAAMHTSNTHTQIMDHTQQAQMYPNEYIDQAKAPPNPLEALYPNYFGGAPQFEESQYYDRPSFGQLITKPLHKIGNRLGASRSSSTHSRPSSSMSQTMTDLNADYPVAVMGMRHTPEPQQQQQSLHQMQHQQHIQHQQHLMHHQQQSFRHLTPQMHDQLHMYATQN